MLIEFYVKKDITTFLNSKIDACMVEFISVKKSFMSDNKPSETSICFKPEQCFICATHKITAWLIFFCVEVGKEFYLNQQQKPHTVLTTEGEPDWLSCDFYSQAILVLWKGECVPSKLQYQIHPLLLYAHWSPVEWGFCGFLSSLICQSVVSDIILREGIRTLWDSLQSNSK